MSQRYYNNGPAYRQPQAIPPLRQSASFPNIGSDYPLTGLAEQQPLPPLSTPQSQTMSHVTNPARLQPSGNLPAMRGGPDYGTQQAASMAAYASPAAAPAPAQSLMYSSMPGGIQGQPHPHALPRTSSSSMLGMQRPNYTSAPPSTLQLPKIHSGMPMNGPTSLSSMQHPPERHSQQPYSASASPAPRPDQSLSQPPPPKHVVGSQGRRGILPSAAGRPPALTDGSATGNKLPAALAKDADGKYPCPHCNKPYLHAKHLKRHMLRHTGVRPYECALCHDTFSRSDILKRHFQKCSVRRGNPTGENHLAYSRATKKARQQREEMSQRLDNTGHSAVSTSLSTNVTSAEPMASSMPTSYATGTMDSPMGLAALDVGQGFDKQEPLANQVARTNGMRKVNGLGSTSNRGSSSSLNTSAFDPGNSSFSTGHATPDSVTTSGAATPYTYPHDPKSALNSPADAHFPSNVGLGLAANNGQGSGSGAASRAGSGPAAAMYSNGALPHIVGQHHMNGGPPGSGVGGMGTHGRGHDLDWSAAYGSYANNDEHFSGGHPFHHSGTSTPQHEFKHDPTADFAGFDWQTLTGAKQQHERAHY